MIRAAASMLEGPARLLAAVADLERDKLSALSALRPLLVLVGIGLVACEQGVTPGAGSPVVADPVLARVDGEAITARQLTAVINAVPKPDRLDYLVPEARRDLLQSLIDRKLMAREAMRLGLVPASVPEPAVDDPMATETRLAQAYLDARLADLPEPAAADIEAYYATHVDEFALPERVLISRLVFPDAKQAQAALAAARAGAAIETLGDRRTRPATLWLHRGAGEATDFERAAFATLPGELGPLVQAGEGYGVFRVEERRPASRQPLADVQASIIARLETEGRAALIEQTAAELRGRASVEIDTDALRAFDWQELPVRPGNGDGGAMSRTRYFSGS
jgi:hypothetical protein